ncbi:MAG: autotransporter domain-containing protein [Desulfobacteraceae bacterium]|nr:autotransporter domain-containing protein [Desulfobacteraceae bacterium]
MTPFYAQSVTTNASDPAWDMTCDSLDLNQVTATADLQWATRLDRGAWHLTPSASAGLRVLLSDADVTVRQTISGNDPFTVSSHQDDIAAILSLSLGIQTEGCISTVIAYGGDYGENTTRHSLWTKFSFAF